jgi:hypothetical protein
MHNRTFRNLCRDQDHTILSSFKSIMTQFHFTRSSQPNHTPGLMMKLSISFYQSLPIMVHTRKRARIQNGITSLTVSSSHDFSMKETLIHTPTGMSANGQGESVGLIYLNSEKFSFPVTSHSLTGVASLLTCLHTELHTMIQ